MFDNAEILLGEHKWAFYCRSTSHAPRLCGLTKILRNREILRDTAGRKRREGDNAERGHDARVIREKLRIREDNRLRRSNLSCRRG